MFEMNNDYKHLFSAYRDTDETDINGQYPINIYNRIFRIHERIGLLQKKKNVNLLFNE